MFSKIALFNGLGSRYKSDELLRGSRTIIVFNSIASLYVTKKNVVTMPCSTYLNSMKFSCL